MRRMPRCFPSHVHRLAQKPEAIRKEESVGSWLYGVAYRIALNARKKGFDETRTRPARRARGRLKRPTTVPGRGQGGPVCGAEPDLRVLPRSLVLCYLEGKTQDQAAVLLRCIEGDG